MLSQLNLMIVSKWFASALRFISPHSNTVVDAVLEIVVVPLGGFFRTGIFGIHGPLVKPAAKNAKICIDCECNDDFRIFVYVYCIVVIFWFRLLKQNKVSCHSYEPLPAVSRIRADRYFSGLDAFVSYVIRHFDFLAPFPWSRPNHRGKNA
jgi:hypothetical protein